MRVPIEMELYRRVVSIVIKKITNVILGVRLENCKLLRCDRKKKNKKKIDKTVHARLTSLAYSTAEKTTPNKHLDKHKF